MSLDFHFGPHDHPRWKDLFKKFGRLDLQFFYDVLPWLCMATRIGYVSEETIPHIIARSDVSNALSRHHRNDQSSLRNQLLLLQLANEHGEDAAATYQKAQAAAEELIAKALPKDFRADPVRTLKRFIGTRTNVSTESTQAFLSDLKQLRFDPMPNLTKEAAAKLSTAESKMVKLISSGEAKHPGLEVEEAPATVPA